MLIFKVLSIKDVIDSAVMFIKDILSGIADFFIAIYNFDLTGHQISIWASTALGFVVVMYFYYLLLKLLVWVWDLLLDLISKFDERSKEYKFFRDDGKVSKLGEIITREWQLYLILLTLLVIYTVDFIDFKPMF